MPRKFHSGEETTASNYSIYFHCNSVPALNLLLDMFKITKLPFDLYHLKPFTIAIGQVSYHALPRCQGWPVFYFEANTFFLSRSITAEEIQVPELHIKS